jgi:nucleoside-diphosphate-sugar epimerase
VRILVTGATGFIGRHLVDTLKEKDHHVIALVRQNVQRFLVPPWIYDGTVDIVLGNVTNIEDVKNAVKDVDVVFHLAALVGRRRVPESEYYRVNVLGTKTLVDQCYTFGVDYFVFISTAAVMRRRQFLPASANYTRSPISYYQESKYQAELEVEKAIHERDFPATIVRPARTYGPADKDFVELFKVLKRFKVFPLINGGYNTFQPIYVKDLVRFLTICMEKHETTEKKTYVAAGVERITFKELLRLAAEIMGARVIALNIPINLAWAIANVNEVVGAVLNRELPLTRDRVRFFAENYIYDVEKTYEDTGFTPKTDIITGLRETIMWCKKHGIL